MSDSIEQGWHLRRYWCRTTTASTSSRTATTEARRCDVRARPTPGRSSFRRHRGTRSLLESVMPALSKEVMLWVTPGGSCLVASPMRSLNLRNSSSKSPPRRLLAGLSTNDFRQPVTVHPHHRSKSFGPPMESGFMSSAPNPAFSQCPIDPRFWLHLHTHRPPVQTSQNTRRWCRRPSRYVPNDHLVGFAVAEFGIGNDVAARMAAIADWIWRRIPTSTDQATCTIPPRIRS